jgi:hypothetical protein
LDFGSVVVGTSSDQMASSVHNYTSYTLPAPPVTLSGPDASQFTLLDVPPACLASTILPPLEGGCGILVIFSPTSPGLKTATISVAEYTVTVTGTGISPT